MGSLFLVRHSLTEAAVAGRNLGRGSDPSITREGRALARALAHAIEAEMTELPHDDLRVISSPALRCRQTAEPLLATLGPPAPTVEVEPAIIELDYGKWEGLTGDEAGASDPRRRAAWEADPWSTRCPGGESGGDVAARSFPVLEAIENWAARGRERCAIVVAHNHVNRLRLCALLGWPMADYRRRIAQDPAGYSLLTFGDGLPVLRRLNAAPA